MKRTAFTMIELVFVIVILGILAAVAIPKFAATRDDAQIAKGRSDVAAIRAAIVGERQGRLLQGQSNYINQLHHGTDVLFDANGTATTDGKLLQYGITTQADTNGHWQPYATSLQYKYHILGGDVVFTYAPTTGTFNCTPASTATTDPCRLLTN
ncbi:MAG: prepilin-type N-terminal cleavage/methylation domain-containing protein [Campylobacterales bacterium]|nr:prepilin-type N-terminal cleavage/methylation domain-containing protein [Campylobacterales bacterium]